MAIMLFGLLVLSVVLLDGMAISVNAPEQALANRNVVRRMYCHKAYGTFPPQCLVTAMYSCGDHYILQSSCLGVGEVIVGERGQFQAWCGYNAFGTKSPDCQPYRLDARRRDCTKTDNLCVTK